MLSIIIPSYNEEKMIAETAQTIGQIMKENRIPYRILFVNDGSSDHTWERIEEAAKADPQVSGLCFSRNFGKESAMMAGLSYAFNGLPPEEEERSCAAVMDCDLQHPPQTLVEMYHLWEQGYEVVEGVKRSRGEESAIHRMMVGIFYSIMSRAVGIDMSRASDFKLMDRTVVETLVAMPERNAFFRALSSWVGYRTTSVEFDVQERTEGESKWSTKSLIKYAIRNIVGFSSAPMMFVTWAGALTLLFAIILGIQSLVRYFTGHAVEGFTTVILLLLLIGSVIMISLGIIGVYLANIYEEVKARPKFIVSETVGSVSEKQKAG